MLPKATVEYANYEGLTTVAESNTVSVRVVKADVSISRNPAPSSLEVDRVFQVTYKILNEGDGEAHDINVVVNISRGLEIVKVQGAEKTAHRSVVLFADVLKPKQTIDI